MILKTTMDAKLLSPSLPYFFSHLFLSHCFILLFLTPTLGPYPCMLLYGVPSSVLPKQSQAAMQFLLHIDLTVAFLMTVVLKRFLKTFLVIT